MITDLNLNLHLPSPLHRQGRDLFYTQIIDKFADEIAIAVFDITTTGVWRSDLPDSFFTHIHALLHIESKPHIGSPGKPCVRKWSGIDATEPEKEIPDI